MAKRKLFNLNFDEFNDLLTEFDGLGGNLKPVVTKALEDVADTVEADTEKALVKSNMPAQGKYSSGETEKSMVRNAKVEWSGTIAEIGLGFDFDKPGAAGYLISGTPRMKPNKELQRIYKRKKYLKDIQNDMSNTVIEAIDEEVSDKNGR